MDSRLIGIDYGMARIGIAVSDPSKIIAASLETMKAEKKVEATSKKLLHYLEEYCKKSRCKIDLIIIGMPLMMSGEKRFFS